MTMTDLVIIAITSTSHHIFEQGSLEDRSNDGSNGQMIARMIARRSLEDRPNGWGHWMGPDPAVAVATRRPETIISYLRELNKNPVEANSDLSERESNDRSEFGGDFILR